MWSRWDHFKVPVNKTRRFNTQPALLDVDNMGK